MSGIKVYNYRDIEFNTINFENPKKVKGGGYMSLISYGPNKNRFIIQSPKLKTSNGIHNNNLRSYIELLLDKGHWPFYQFLDYLDSHILTIVNDNSLNWFEQTFPLDVLEELYQSNMRINGKNNIPKIKFKIHKSKGDLNCNIYNNKNELQLENFVETGNKVVCILELIGIKFLKQQLYLEWKTLQIKVYDNKKDVIDNCIINNNLLSDNEDNENYEDNIDNEDKNNQNIHFENDELIFDDIDKEINNELKLFEKDSVNKNDLDIMTNLINKKIDNMHKTQGCNENQEHNLKIEISDSNTHAEVSIKDKESTKENELGIKTNFGL